MFLHNLILGRIGLRPVFSSGFFPQCPLRMELIWFCPMLKDETMPKPVTRNTSWCFFTNMGLRVVVSIWALFRILKCYYKYFISLRKSSFCVGHSKIVGIACLSCWMKGAEHLMRPSRGKGSLFPLNICLCLLVRQITFKLVPSFLIPKI